MDTHNSFEIGKERTSLSAWTITGTTLTFDASAMLGPFPVPCSISGSTVTVSTNPIPSSLRDLLLI